MGSAVDPDRALTKALFAYIAASLLHHAHNAWFLNVYPNLPGWLSPSGVMVAWSLETAVGLAGLSFIRRGRRSIGCLLLALYAAAGFGGLDHYTLAPMTQRTQKNHHEQQ